MNNMRTDILLVEDNPDEALLAMRQLRKNETGQDILHVKDGVEALDFIFGKGAYMGRDIAKPPKVVLLDVNMPRINGIEVLETVRADERTKGIPILVMVATATVPDVEKATALGASGFLVKPVTLESFGEAMQKLGMR